MKKCCFIIPYFGKLPSFFSVFAKTCEKNQDFDWMIFTDDQSELKVPNNVIINKMNYEDLKKLYHISARCKADKWVPIADPGHIPWQEERLTWQDDDIFHRLCGCVLLCIRMMSDKDLT